MDSERQRRIRERAYDLWVEGGRLHGRDEENWSRAEREVDAQPERAKTKPAARRTAAAEPAAPAKAKAGSAEKPSRRAAEAAPGEAPAAKPKRAAAKAEPLPKGRKPKA